MKIRKLHNKELYVMLSGRKKIRNLISLPDVMTVIQQTLANPQ
jgi:hypothetical protein